MGVKIDLHKASGKSDEKSLILSAFFTMVARGPDGQAFQVNSLAPETASEIEEFRRAEEQRTRRLSEKKHSLEFESPTIDETTALHILATKTAKVRIGLELASVV